MHISFLILPLFFFCSVSLFCPDVSADHFAHPHPPALFLAFLCHHVQTRFSFHPLFRAVISQAHPFFSRPFVLLFCSYVDVVLVFRSCRITGGAPLKKLGITTQRRTDTGLCFPERSADKIPWNLNYTDRVPFIFYQNAKSHFNTMEGPRRLQYPECPAVTEHRTIFTIFLLHFRYQRVSLEHMSKHKLLQDLGCDFPEFLLLLERADLDWFHR